MRKIFLFFLFFCSLNKSIAAELMTSAGQIKKNTFSWSIYYTKGGNKVDIKIGEEIKLCQEDGEKFIFRLSYGFWTNFYPWIKVGFNLILKVTPYLFPQIQ